MARLNRDAYHEETERRFRNQLERVRRQMRKQQHKEDNSNEAEDSEVPETKLTVVNVSSPKSDNKNTVFSNNVSVESVRFVENLDFRRRRQLWRDQQ